MHDLCVENVTTIIIHTTDTILLDLTFNRSVIKRKLYRYFPNACNIENFNGCLQLHSSLFYIRCNLDFIHNSDESIRKFTGS